MKTKILAFLLLVLPALAGLNERGDLVPEPTPAATPETTPEGSPVHQRLPHLVPAATPSPTPERQQP